MSVALKMKQSLAQAERISVSTFARKAKTGRNSVRRILDSRNTSVTLKSIGRVAEALNLDFTLTAKPMTPAQLGKIADELDPPTPATKRSSKKNSSPAFTASRSNRFRPRIQRSEVPEELLRHLIRRRAESGVTTEDLVQFAAWLDRNPTEPDGKWFKRVQGLLCVVKETS
jgi:transcriptional regulator with XRE-family HTH domain